MPTSGIIIFEVLENYYVNIVVSILELTAEKKRQMSMKGKVTAQTRAQGSSTKTSESTRGWPNGYKAALVVHDPALLLMTDTS